MTRFVAPVVEGHTEVRVIELLLQRVWSRTADRTGRLQVLRAILCKRSSLIASTSVIKMPELLNKIEQAISLLRVRSKKEPKSKLIILLLIDSERDCPAQLAPRFLEARQHIPVDILLSCVLPKRSIENWIVAGASTLANKNGLPDSLPNVDDAENMNAVAWLDRRKKDADLGAKYAKTIDAEEFIRSMSIEEAESRSESFAKLCREVNNW